MTTPPPSDNSSLPCPHLRNETHSLLESVSSSDLATNQPNTSHASSEQNEQFAARGAGVSREHQRKRRTRAEDAHFVGSGRVADGHSESSRWPVTPEPLQTPADSPPNNNNDGNMEESSECSGDSEMECDDIAGDVDWNGDDSPAGVSDALPCGFDILRAAELCGKDAVSSGADDQWLSIDESADDFDDVSNDRISPPGLTGFRNIGNTCYLNAVLQALVHLPPFFVHFIECARLLPPDARLAASLAQLLGRLWSRKRLGWVEPTGVLLAVCAAHRQFVGAAQHDGQELLRCLLDTLHEELRQPVGPGDALAPGGVPAAAGDSRASSRASGNDGDDEDDDTRYETADSGVSEQSCVSTTAPLRCLDHAESNSITAADGNISRSDCADVEMVTYGYGQGDADYGEPLVPPPPPLPQPPLSCESRSQKCQKQQQQQQQPQQNYESIVSRVFDGTLVSSAECLSCHRVSTTRETFQDLSLPIPSQPSSSPKTVALSGRTSGGVEGGWWDWIWDWTLGWWLPVFWNSASVYGPTVSLYDCLDAFFSTDELTDDNMYSCDRCRKLRRGLRYCRIVQLPEVLTIHLKRFRHELYSSTKLSTRVTFPLRGLQMASYTDSVRPPCVTDYNLAAAVCHSGGASGGHYTALVLHADSGYWYEFDDMCVRRVGVETVAGSQPYILFYRKSDSIAVQRRGHAVQIASSHPASASLHTYFLSRQWLSRFNTFAEPGPIDNTSFACVHGARRPDVVPGRARTACVRVSAPVWQYLRDWMGGGPAAPTLHVCRVCAEAWRALRRRRRRERAQFRRHVRQRGRGHCRPGAGDLAGPSCCYAVVCNWLRRWEAFVNDDGVLQPPGPVDNTSIVETCRQGNVQLREGSDYAAIDCDLWRYLVSIYGGGPSVPLCGQTAEVNLSPDDNCNSRLSVDKPVETTSEVSTDDITSGVASLDSLQSSATECSDVTMSNTNDVMQETVHTSVVTSATS